MDERLFEYRGKIYPDYIRRGNAMKFAAPFAKPFCVGNGLDIGSNKWPLFGAKPIDIINDNDAMDLPNEKYDYIFSSHCVEHLPDPIKAIEHWKSRLKVGGVIFLYLPHPQMEYWLPQFNRKHLHSWMPADMAKILTDLGFVDVIHSERDLAWGFCCVGFNGESI